MDTPKNIGRYEIIEELGHGAMGNVYRANDPAMGRVVALKTIISVVLESEKGGEFRERFYREARAAGALAHPGIVPVFDVGEYEGMPFLVMEFVKGQTLADIAKKGERLSLDRVCTIGQKIAEALGYAHQRGVVHRDIKPANILMTSREVYGIERPKITDFGVAKLAEGQTTLTGQLLGTPAFMPPEQFTGAPIDGRADIFSLGVVLYLMTTGEQPFPGESMTAVSYKVVHTDPVPPRKLNPSVPAKLENIILKCLAKSPEERYQTGDELARDLGELRAGNTMSASQGTAPGEASAGSDMDATFVETTPRMAAAPVVTAPQPQSAASAEGKRSNRLIGIAVVAIVIVVAAGGGWYAARTRHPSATPTVTPAPAAMNTVPVTVPAAVLAAVPAETNVPGEPAGTAAPSPIVSPIASPKASPKPNTPAPGATAAAKVPAAKAAPKPAAKADAAVPAKVVDAPPEVAALDFDPKTLDSKQNARLKIDAEKMPAGVEFTVEMNGKTYFQKTGVKANTIDDNFFVPPGVQEFRVTAKSGAIEKKSNTVSSEFKAKKRNTLTIELRTQGKQAGAGVPQGLYPDTEIVLTLK